MTPGSVRRVRVRLLPWRPRWRAKDAPDGDLSGLLDAFDDPVSAVVGLLFALVLLPLVLFVLFGVVLFSLEIGLLLALAPLLVVVQLLGLRPWYLAVTTVDGERTYVRAGRTRAMLSARRYYRSLRP